MKISIPAILTSEKQGGVGKEAWLIREQSAVLVVPGKLSGIEFTFRLKNNEDPVAIGEYEVDGASFSGGKYGRIEFSPRPGKPIAAQSTAPKLSAVSGQKA